MRATLLAGVTLAVAAVLVVLVSSGLDLELESVALLGAALGAVVALVPDRTPLVRLGGFAAGFVAAWVGYVVRAALSCPTPPAAAPSPSAWSSCSASASPPPPWTGCPLWTTLLGTAAFAGAYEFTYAAAPPELLSTSVSTATTLLLNVAVGFLAAALVAPGAAAGLAPLQRAGATTRRPRHRRPTRTDARLDDFMMEKTK